ncbi:MULTISPECIES: CHAT domain-containing protein [unclassified Streptomyces]|uniref:CHAT domain-containing protein n=1 Tax=unclassified Streptomyces TaxID=2593676 RepID=UPI002E8080E6|nr:CHAT domain-containing protein [Streptomyces sp. NBC_00589]WTI39418.1 CHAT domain-containing protein [Streptomyces sp. NBC_00775]WUB26904.1 CHAT domain-containing protein [Streptomyces sp. NBC_00589]
MSQHMTFSGTISAHATVDQGTIAPTGISRRVLFLSGDPRPGRNDFGSEAACVRQALVGSFVQLIEMASVQLAEICPALDQYSPAVLHIAAHSAFGGVHLTQEGSDLSIAYRDLCAQIARVRSPPRLVILNVCDSVALADQLARTIAAVISWPYAISDAQAQVFTRQLYRSLTGQRSIAESCKDSEAALTGPHPDCPPPVLHGLATSRAF